jgi:GDPmannose 4,6-dehydratase
MIRRSSSFNTGRIEHIRDKLNLLYGDMTDLGSIMNILRTSSEDNPDSVIELYNLAAMSHVRVSFEIEKYVADVDAIGVLNVLQSIKTLKLENRVIL